MVIVGAAVANQSDLAAGGAPERGVVVCHADAELIHAVHTHRNDRRLVGATGDDIICDVDAVQGDGVLVAACAGDGTAAIAKSRRVVIGSGSRLQSEELSRVTV